MRNSNLILFAAAITFQFLIANTATSQTYENTQVTIKLKNTTLKKIISEIEKQTPYRFAFVESDIASFKNKDVDFVKEYLPKCLSKIFESSDISFKLVDNTIIILKKKTSSVATTEVINDNTHSPPTDWVIIGIVKDQNGSPLIGSTIKIKGTNSSTLTDKEGKFSLKTNKPLVDLTFTHVSYTTVEQKAMISTESLFITMYETSSKLDEVIVVGYGSVKKRDLTGSVGKVNMEDFHKAPVSSFDQALQGRVAGVVVSSNDGQPGAGSSISIRGTSFTQDASPLYVVDGFPIENMNINSINPADIESLEVLKDASSIAIYGSRASNGVIMITTRKGKASTPIVSYSFSSGLQRATKTIPVLNPYEFVKLQLELDSLASTPTLPITRYHDIYLNPSLGIGLDYYKNVKGFDWQKLLLKDGSIQTHDLNISGGNGDTRYSISASAFKQDGIIINTGLKRYSGRFTLDMKLAKNLAWGLNTSFTNSLSNGTVPSSGNGGGVVQSMWQYRPVAGLKNSQDLINNLIDSTAMQDFLNGTGSIGDNQINPLMQAQNEFRQSRKNDATINSFLEYTLFKNIKLRVTGGYTALDLKHSTFYNSSTQQGNLFVNAAGGVANQNGINGGIQNVLTQNLLNENTLSYNGRIDNNHIINFITGFTYQYGQSENYGFTANNIAPSQQYLVIDNALSAGTPSSIVGGKQHNQLYSFLARGNYILDQKYLFTATVRSDGSSKFGVGHQWGYFPSAAVAWRFTEESWLKKIIHGVVTNGKLRASYGTVGNNRVPDVNYAWAGSLSPSNGYAISSGQFLPGNVPVFYASPNLTWETTKEFDLGITTSLLKDRVSIEADYYDKRTSNFLMNVTLPSFGGYNDVQQYQNTGVVGNKGFEFSITTENILTPTFSWQTNFNISFNQNKILSFYNNVTSIGANWGLNGASQAWIAKVGGPVSQFFGYQAAGLYQYQDFNRLANGTYALKPGIPTYSPNIQPGDQKYADLNHDGIIDGNDETTLGTNLPIHTGGISNNFRYKNFSLNIFLQWSYGGKVLNANKVAFETTGDYFAFGNQFAAYANRWEPNHTNTDIPRAFTKNPKGDELDNNPNPSSRFIEDGSYLRLKTIQLNYEIPTTVLKRVNLNRVSVYVAAQNLLTLTHYSGLDPEVSTSRIFNSAKSPINNTGNIESGLGYSYVQPSSGSAVLQSGYDYTPYPRAFTLTGGLRITF